MGGMTLVVRASSKEEVEANLAKRVTEAKFLGLYEEARTTAEYDENSQQYRAMIKFHS